MATFSICMAIFDDVMWLITVQEWPGLYPSRTRFISLSFVFTGGRFTITFSNPWKVEHVLYFRTYHHSELFLITCYKNHPNVVSNWSFTSRFHFEFIIFFANLLWIYYQYDEMTVARPLCNWEGYLYRP